MEIAETSTYIANQYWDLSIGVERLPAVSLFYFEGASLDARENRQLSEDFLSYQYIDNCLYFIVCDGVQQSMDASMAARFLGLSLLDILPNAKGDKEKLESFLGKQRAIIEKKILSTTFDENDPLLPLHMRARNEIGAQVKFACGVVDFNRKKTEVYFAGDVRFVVYGKNLEPLFYWNEDNNQFWSTRGSYSLNLGLRSWDISEISQLSITSDGIREDFNEILSRRKTLHDTKLIHNRYQIGADDISGIDIMIQPVYDASRLPAIKSVKLIKNRDLVWSHVSRAESYRIYFISGNIIRNVVEIDSNQKLYQLPPNLEDGNFYIQALSSKDISSELSKPVHYVAIYDQISEPQLGEPLVPQTLEPPVGHPTPTSAPTIQPNRDWQRIAIGCGGVVILGFLLLGFFSSSAIMSYLQKPTMTLIFDTPTYISSTPNFTLTFTPAQTASSPAPSPTATTPSTFTFAGTDLVSQTPPTISIPDTDLSECQRETMLAEPDKWTKYQIRPGDTFFGLSYQYSTSVEELMRVNCNQTTALITNEFILIPKTE